MEKFNINGNKKVSIYVVENEQETEYNKNISLMKSVSATRRASEKGRFTYGTHDQAE